MNIEESLKLVQAADICGHVPLFKGVHGIGKSESVAQYATQNNMHFEPLILSLMDTGDMLGLPETRDVNGMPATVWAAPSWYSNIVNAAWPKSLRISRLQFEDTDLQAYVMDYMKDKDNARIAREELNNLYCEYYDIPNDTLQILRQDNVHYLDSKRSALFLDEFNRAPADILNASLQLINDHRLHSHVLPRIRGQETLIVAAINPADGDYTVQEFDAALLDRFVDCDVEPDLKSWLVWAKEKNVNKIVRDFLIDNQTKFHFTPKDGSKGASPRSWYKVAKYIDALENTSKDIMSYYIKGLLGSAIASQFLIFYHNYESNITTKDIANFINKEIKAVKKNKQPVVIEEIAEKVSELIENVESIKKLEFADTFHHQYIHEEPEDALVLMIYLYALPIENLSAVLKQIQADYPTNYGKLAKIDKELNDKKLFLKIVSNLKGI